MATESPQTISQRLNAVAESAHESAAAYEERDEKGEGSGRWGELSAGMDELGKVIEEAAGEADDLASTYSDELGNTNY